MKPDWRKPNADEQKRGFVAICMVTETLRTYGAKDNVRGHVSYLRPYCYTAAMLERRAARGGDCPEWYEVQADSSDDWLDYIDTGKTSQAIEAILPTPGSYEVQRLGSVA